MMQVIGARSAILASRRGHFLVRASSIAANPTSFANGAGEARSSKGAVIELNQPKRRKQGERESSGGFGDDHLLSFQSFLLLLVPGSTFALGCWQIKRWKWKKTLIAELERTGNPNGIEYRDDHMTYILTWFTLSVLTSMMWAQKFIIPRLKHLKIIR